MRKVENIDILPRPLRVLAKSFLNMDTNLPDILEAHVEEMSKLRSEEEVVFQLVLDKQWMRWYLVAAGDQNRTKQSDMIIHRPMEVKRSLLVFAPVDDAWLRNKRHEYDNHMMYQNDRAQVWDGQKFSLEPVAVDFSEAGETLDVEEVYG